MGVGSARRFVEEECPGAAIEVRHHSTYGKWYVVMCQGVELQRGNRNRCGTKKAAWIEAELWVNTHPQHRIRRVPPGTVKGSAIGTNIAVLNDA